MCCHRLTTKTQDLCLTTDIFTSRVQCGHDRCRFAAADSRFHKGIRASIQYLDWRCDVAETRPAGNRREHIDMVVISTHASLVGAHVFGSIGKSRQRRNVALLCVLKPVACAGAPILMATSFEYDPPPDEDRRGSELTILSCHRVSFFRRACSGILFPVVGLRNGSSDHRPAETLVLR